MLENPARLPRIPVEFEPYTSPHSSHKREAHLPAGFFERFESPSQPREFFELYFTNDELQTLANNTNSYTELKQAGQIGQRRWYPISPPELKIFKDIIIHMGIFCSARCKDYCSRNSFYPEHAIGHYMTLLRFEQIKDISMYLTLLYTYTELNGTRKWSFCYPTYLRNSIKPMTPSMNVLVDKMVVRFTGRSIHIKRIHGKPISCCYKIIAPYEHGYTFNLNFLYTS